jgi:hypothetical protein
MSDTYKNQQYISCYSYDRITKNHTLGSRRDPSWYVKGCDHCLCHRLICKLLFLGSFARISVLGAVVWRGERHVTLLVLWTSEKAVVPIRAKGKLCSPLCKTADGTRKRLIRSICPLRRWRDNSAGCIVLLVYANFVKQRGRKTCLALEQKNRELHFTTWQPLSYVWSSLLPRRIVKWHRFKTFVRTMSYCLAEMTVVWTQQCTCCGELLVRVRTAYIARELWDMDYA